MVRRSRDGTPRNKTVRADQSSKAFQTQGGESNRGPTGGYFYPSTSYYGNEVSYSIPPAAHNPPAIPLNIHSSMNRGMLATSVSPESTQYLQSIPGATNIPNGFIPVPLVYGGPQDGSGANGTFTLPPGFNFNGFSIPWPQGNSGAEVIQPSPQSQSEIVKIEPDEEPVSEKPKRKRARKPQVQKRAEFAEICILCRDLLPSERPILYETLNAIEEHARVHSVQNGQSLEQTVLMCFGSRMKERIWSSGTEKADGSQGYDTNSVQVNQYTVNTNKRRGNSFSPKAALNLLLRAKNQSTATQRRASETGPSTQSVKERNQSQIKEKEANAHNEKALKKTTTPASLISAKTGAQSFHRPRNGKRKSKSGASGFGEGPDMNPMVVLSQMEPYMFDLTYRTKEAVNYAGADTYSPLKKSRKSKDSRSNKNQTNSKNSSTPRGKISATKKASPPSEVILDHRNPDESEFPVALSDSLAIYNDVLADKILLIHQREITECKFERCKKKFQIQETISTLNQHILTHSEFTTHLCRICSKSFKSSTIENHIRKEHRLTPSSNRIADNRYKFEPLLVDLAEKCLKSSGSSEAGLSQAQIDELYETSLAKVAKEGWGTKDHGNSNEEDIYEITLAQETFSFNNCSPIQRKGAALGTPPEAKLFRINTLASTQKLKSNCSGKPIQVLDSGGTTKKTGTPCQKQNVPKSQNCFKTPQLTSTPLNHIKRKTNPQKIPKSQVSKEPKKGVINSGGKQDKISASPALKVPNKPDTPRPATVSRVGGSLKSASIATSQKPKKPSKSVPKNSTEKSTNKDTPKIVEKENKLTNNVKKNSTIHRITKENQNIHSEGSMTSPPDKEKTSISKVVPGPRPLNYVRVLREMGGQTKRNNQNSAVCKLCKTRVSWQTWDMRIIDRHLTTNHLTDLFKCILCEARVPKRNFDSHSRNHPGVYVQFRDLRAEHESELLQIFQQCFGQ